MKILCVGGGPAGLYFGIRMKQLDRLHEVTVLERNRPDDTFGFGVVFSDSTLGYLHQHDARTYELISNNCQSWDPIEVRFGGKMLRCGGNGFSAISRKRLLSLLQRKALDLGVTIRFQTEFGGAANIKQYDLVVAADGINSTVRRMFAAQFRPTIEMGTAKYIWFGTTQHFDSLTFLFEENEHGLFGVHTYPYDEYTSTFIVETDEDTWHNADLKRHFESTLAPGKSDRESMAYCQNLFTRHLHGHVLLANNSKWLNFRTLRTETWHHKNIVLMGDAAHTAHFSVGSGTKMAMEDAIALSLALQEHADIPDALTAYEQVRRPEVERIQRASEPSRQWWEDFRRYKHFSPEQFTFNFLTRNPRVTYENLQRRDPHYVAQVHSWFLAQTKPSSEVAQSTSSGEERLPSPVSQPFQLRDLSLAHRLAIALPIHYTVKEQPGGKRSARLTLLTDIFAEVQAKAHIGLVLVQPPANEYETFMAWHHLLQVHPMFHDLLNKHVGLSIPPLATEFTLAQESEDQISQLLNHYAEIARLAVTDQYDMLELNFTGNSFPFKFNAPAAKARTNDENGSLYTRFPFEVLDAVRSVWLNERPLAVRLSVPEPGIADDDEVLDVARHLREHSCDLISIEVGDTTSKDVRTARLRQRLLNDRIRNELSIPTMLIGGAANRDEINTYILSGRTDLYLLD